MQAPLWKGNLDFSLPEPPLNLLVEFTAYGQHIVNIPDPHPEFKVKPAFPETHEQDLRLWVFHQLWV
jgi:hypothetical protein